MSNPTPELPEDIRKDIEVKSEEYAEDAGYMSYGLKSLTAIKGYVAGATEYAAIAIQLQNALALISEYGPDKYVAEVCREALALFPVDKKKEE